MSSLENLRKGIEETLPPVFAKDLPESISDLRAIERRTQALTRVAEQSTVAVQVGPAHGTGVIVSSDGYVITAAHVAGGPGKSVKLRLWDGRTVYGKTLGHNKTIDAGLMKINDSNEVWPYAEMVHPNQAVVPGDWCLAAGHPGGFQADRRAVFRLGRVILVSDQVIQTDNELVGGDSGGPLYDMQGRVIAVHSRIGPGTAFNFHVPAHSYRRDWDRLVAGESFIEHSGAVLGVSGRDHKDGIELTKVHPGDPAAEAGLREGDVITHFQRHRIYNIDQLIELVGSRSAGESVRVRILREGEQQSPRIRLGYDAKVEGKIVVSK